MYVVYINLLYFLSIFLFTYNKNLLSQKNSMEQPLIYNSVHLQFLSFTSVANLAALGCVRFFFFNIFNA